ncbi:10119_t:CDS:1 [Diversispora eburnea]|uniref:10119_t:CDS:1 n=1 Tax=Diversispora eburnea TaxID=1213867 RepID=A0A9N8VA18_9GLOM|nr:10119_t:CDS:1 [Diversispora eburnea]
MTSPKSTQKITDKLEQVNELLEHIDAKIHFKPLSDKCKIHAFSFEFAENLDSNPTSIIRDNATQHGFTSAIIHAYTLHQHLRFSPDDVWLTVAQGVGKHILINAERFRNIFFDHEGQKGVTVEARDIIKPVNKSFKDDWLQAVARLSDDIDKRVKKVDLKKHLECNFSTSTNASITASKIILLEAMKKGFSYELRGGCGIPKVTLDGTLEDWLKLQEKVAKIRDFGLGLDFWLDRLKPVIAQFVSTYKGDVDEKFWSMAVFEVPYNSYEATPCWDGWISAFFPHNKSGSEIKKNQIIPNEIPSGLVYVPFDLIVVQGDIFKLNFAAGFFGARQEKVNEEYIVSPVIGWYIVDKIDEVMDAK